MESIVQSSSKLDETAVRIAKEYEDFAYIVSHDFSAPLRHIREFTKLILDSQKANLDGESLRYAEYLEKSLQKLEDMQQALLSFSRIGTRAVSLRAVSLQESLESVVQELESNSKYGPFTLQSEPLPTLVAEPNLIRVLFYNILDNALKFNKNKFVDRCIVINTKPDEDHWHFEITDNGIGIDVARYDEVFKMFRRLHGDSYPGMGIGLPIAQKIVRLHNGVISVATAVGGGTIVRFTLDKYLHQPVM